MTAYIEYELDDGSTILIVAPDEEMTGMAPASRGGSQVIKSQMKLREALKGAKAQAKILLEEIEGLHVNEAEIKFVLTTTGELGNLAIGKVGLDVNYEVTLKWMRKEQVHQPEQ